MRASTYALRDACVTSDVVEGRNKRENSQRGGRISQKKGLLCALNVAYIYLRDGTSPQYSHEYDGLRASRQSCRGRGGKRERRHLLWNRGIIFLAFIPARRESGLPASLSPRFRESGSNSRHLSWFSSSFRLPVRQARRRKETSSPGFCIRRDATRRTDRASLGEPDGFDDLRQMRNGASLNAFNYRDILMLLARLTAVWSWFYAETI